LKRIRIEWNPKKKTSRNLSRVSGMFFSVDNSSYENSISVDLELLNFRKISPQVA
jgi:hypothetical protein